MKKVLFATTALVASAGFAAADVKLTGGAKVGFEKIGGGDTVLDTLIDFNIIGTLTSDNGLTFGASLDIDENDPVDDPEIYVKGDFGTLTFGDVDVASDALGLADFGYDGIGFDNIAEAGRNQGAADIHYEYSVDGLTVIATAGFNGATEGDFGLALGYEANGFSGMVGFSSDDSASTDATSVQLGYSADGLGVTALYVDADGAEAWGVIGSYKMDALKVSLGIADNDSSSDTSFGVGVDYSLGGGATLAAGFGDIDGSNNWSLGIKLSF